MSTKTKKSFILEKSDIEKNIYFIAEMAQNAGEKGMYGGLARKSDLMGGIFDRWINQTAESVIFNKCILKEIKHNKNVEVVIDFYKYKPKQETTGLAPDVIGLKINNKVIPFVVYDNKWTPVFNKPQIEVKTFKATQKMVSLRNQGYTGYLVMVESNLRPDYLLPFFDKNYFTSAVFDEMTMNDEVFIKNNDNNYISHLKQVDVSREDLGTIGLLCVTTAESFMKKSTLCEAGISPIRIDSISESKRNKNMCENISLSACCSLDVDRSLYNFNQGWNDEKNNEKYLHFSCSNVDAIKIIKKNKSNIYIEANADCHFNYFPLKKGDVYKISFATLNREGAKEKEYFLQKELIGEVDSFETILEKDLERIILEEK